MIIRDVEILPVQATGSGCEDPLDPSQHTVLVRITNAEGHTGIGETDAPPSAERVFLEMPGDLIGAHCYYSGNLHRNGSVILFVDGHVKYYREGEGRRTPRQTTFPTASTVFRNLDSPT